MAALTTQDVLAAAGRPGWTVVSIQAGTQKNPQSSADWSIDHPATPYPAEIPNGKYVIQVRPPAGSNLPQEAQSITVEADSSITGQGAPGADINPFLSFYQTHTGKDPNLAPVWKPGSVTAPDKAPPAVPAGAKPSSVSAPSSEQFLLVRDPATGAISSQVNPNYVAPKAGAPPTVQTSSGVYERQPDGTYKQVLAADKAPHIVGGTAASDQYLIVEDSAGNRSQIANPNYRAPKPSVIGGTNTTDQFTITQNPDGTTSQSPNPNYVPPKPNVVGGVNTSDQYIITQNPDGTTSQSPNPNYVPAKPVLAAGGQAGDKYIVTMAPDGTLTNTPNPNYQSGKPALEPGYQNNPKIPELVQGEDGQWTVQWIDNQGQAAVPTDTLQTLAQQIGVKLGDGSIPLDTAKSLFDMAHQVISDQTNQQVANNQGANVGAGLLQSRMTNATSTVNSVLSGAASNKNFGLGTQLPAGWGSQFLNETNQNLTALGGGQSTFDTAAQLVHNAAPAIQNTATGAAASAAVKLMLDAGQKPVNPPVAPAAVAPPQLRGNASGVGGNGTGVSATPFQAAGFQAPTTTIAPDGTVTIQHTPDSGSGPSGFRAPVMAGVM